MDQPTVTTATSAPRVCIPDPKVRSHGTKIPLLIVGGSAIRNTAIDVSTTARPRLIRRLSTRPATTASNAPTSDKYPAPSRPAKKRKPNNQPPGIAAKTLGRVKKISPGPDVGSRPSANTAGITAKPARSDDVVSPKTVH